MALERIDSLFDLAAINQEYAKYKEVVQSSYDELFKLFELTKKFSGANIGNIGDQTEGLTDKIKKSVVAQDELAKSKEKLAALYTDEAKKIAATRLEIEQATKSNKDAAREALGLVDAYARLNKQYNESQRAAKNIGIEFGTSSKQFKDAAEKANRYGDQLKKLDGAVGQNQRNVGNYKSAFEGISNKADEFVGSLAEMAAGAFTVEKAFEFLKSSIDEFNKAEQAASKLKNTLTNAGRGDLVEPLIKEAEKLSAAFGIVASNDIEESFQKLALSGRLSADQLKQLEPVIINFSTNTGKTLEESTDIFIRALSGQKKGLQGFNAQVSESQTSAKNFEAIMRDVAPKISHSAEEYSKTLEGSQKKVDVAIDELKVKIGKEFAPSLKQGEAALLAFVGNMPSLFTSINDKVEEFHIGIEKIVAAFVYLSSFGQINLGKKIAGQEALLKFQKDNDKAAEESLQTERQVEAAAQKLRDDKSMSLEEQIKLQETINVHNREAYDQAVKDNPNDSKKLIDLAKEISLTNQIIEALKKKPDTAIINPTQDIEALKRLNAELEKLILLRHKLQIEIDNDSAGQQNTPFKIRLADAKEAHALELQDRKDLEKNQLALIGLTANQKKAIELQYNLDVYGINKKYLTLETQLLEEYKTTEAKLLEDETQYFIDQAQKRLDAFQKLHDEQKEISTNSLEDEKNIQLKKLDEQYSKRLISTYNYGIKKQQIEDKAAKDSINSQLYHLQEERQKLPADFEQATPEQKVAITANDKAQSGLKAQGAAVDVNDETIAKAKRKRILDASIQLFDNLEALGQELVDSSYQKQLDALQKLTDANEKLKSAELDRIASSTLSEQDKAAKVTLLNAQYQAQQEAIALQERKIKHDQAVADKAFSIAKTIEEGIVATVAAIAEGGPVLGAIVAAASAVLLAKVIATPIPAYMEGTPLEGHAGGLMKVHPNELRIDPSGKISMTPNAPETLTWGAKGTHIIPKDEVDTLMRKSIDRMHVDEHGILRMYAKTDETTNEIKKLNNTIIWQTGKLAKAFSRKTTIKNEIKLGRIEYLDKKVYK